MFTLWPVTMMCVGLFYLPSCPSKPLLPTSLFALGFLLSFQNAINYYSSSCFPNEMFRKTVIQSTNVTINLLLTVLLISFAGAIYTTDRVGQVDEGTICSFEAGSTPCVNDQDVSNETSSENSTLVPTNSTVLSIPVYEIIGANDKEQVTDHCSPVIVNFSLYLINCLVAILCVLIAIKIILRLIGCEMTQCKVLKDNCLSVRA